MKIIFLDIDGVLNSATFMKKRQQYKGIHKTPFQFHLEQIDVDAVDLLNQIVKTTNAKVVISSTWRIIFSLDELKSLLKTKGFQGEIIDRTPRMPGSFRGEEISEWLKKSHVEDFIILDDDADMEPLMDKLVKTTWQNGLEPVHVSEAIYRLSEEKSE